MPFSIYEKSFAGAIDATAMFKLSYGLFVLTAREGKKDNGCIINTLQQVTTTPNKVSITVNKANYTHDMIMRTGEFNVSIISESAKFDMFKHFGFQSGRNVDKFKDCTPLRSDNGLVFLPRYINSFMSLKVENYVDLDTHGMFICTVTESRVLGDKETMTYSYYHKVIKGVSPKNAPTYIAE